MKKADVISHFGNVNRVAEALGISHVSVLRWGDVIPERCAARLERKTGGILVYDMELYEELEVVSKKRQAA